MRHWREAVKATVLVLGIAACSGDRDSTDTADGLAEPLLPIQGTLAEASPLVLGAGWPQRSCGLELRVETGAASDVKLAAEFSDWNNNALSLSGIDNEGFAIRLEPSDTLQSGGRYAYHYLVDGVQTPEPNPVRFTFVDGCPVPALTMPDCREAPEIRVTGFNAGFDEESGTGAVTAELKLMRAAGDAELEWLELRLDGELLGADTLSVDLSAANVRVDLAGLGGGRHTLSARLGDSEARVAAPVELPFWIEAEPFDWRDATLYMVLVDRFANGQRDNDRSMGPPVHWSKDFHGGDLQGLAEVIRSGYFDSLGVRAIWLSPVNQQPEGHFGDRVSDGRFVGYHGYWPTRARQVDARFGGNAALKDVVRAAHDRGIRVLFDLIANQVHRQHEYLSSNPEWFRTGCVCGIDPDCGWSQRPYDCMFTADLPDIDWTDSEAEQQFIDDAIYWLSEYGIDGFRVDAVKHVEANAIFNLRAEISRRFEQGGARIFMSGETAVNMDDASPGICGAFQFDNGYAWIDGYVGDGALDGQFDFPSFHRLKRLNADELSYREVEAAIRDAETRYHPEGLHVRYLSTHDEPRFASGAAGDCRWDQANPNGQPDCTVTPGPSADGEAYQRLRRAFTILWTMPGIPFLYYGDEIAMPGAKDPDNRRDMVWRDELSHLAMSEAVSNPQQEELREWIQALGQARRQSMAMRRGTRIPLVAEERLLVYAWTHEQDVALVVVNRAAEAVDRELNLPAVSGRKLRTAVGEGRAAVDGARVQVTVGAGQGSVFLSN